MAFGLVWLTIFLLLYNSDRTMFNMALDGIIHRPSEGDYAGRLIHKAINDFNIIVENANNKDRLLESLSDPVVWYNKTYSHTRFPNASPYDRFEFVAPVVHDVAPDWRTNSYEVRFDGVYRFRHPKKQLLKFESGTVIIQNGLITSLKPRDQPNAYTATWINWAFQYYWICCLLGAFLFTMLFFVLPMLPEKLIELLVGVMKRYLGG